jgi:fatty-acyl-CoA synthase
LPGLAEILRERLSRRPERVAARFLSGDGAVEELSAARLIELADDAAMRIAALKLPARSLVGIAQYSGPALHAAWLGCLWAGHVPSMLAPPSPRMEPAKYAAGLRGIVQGLELAAIVVDPTANAALDADLIGATPTLVYEGGVSAPPRAVAAVGEDEVAVVQHSSGTTGQQKAVALTTRQILAHQEAYAERLGLTEQDRIISWLPLYHDMGFVAAFLQPLLAGVEVTEMSPFEWANQPASLLQAIDRWRPTLCWMPNFAFRLLSQPRVLRAAGSLDLSSVRAWVNCSEPVMASCIDDFVAALSPLGLTPGSVTASYAMAENVFAVTQSRPGDAVRLTAHRAALESEGVVRTATDGEATVTLVSNGRALPTTELQVRGEDGAVLPDGCVGELFLRGGHRFAGYFAREDLTRQAISADGWYATGDLGLVADGEVYVTGRRKDLIILRGRNYSAHEIEQEVGALAGVRAGRVVAFSLPDPRIGTERLVILAETSLGEAERGQLALDIRKCVAQTFDTTVSDVRVVPDRWLVKSTSGKLARSDNRAKYLSTWGDA